MARSLSLPDCASTLRAGPLAASLALSIGALALALPAVAHQQAHTHGRLSMDVAVDARTITIAIDSPLDGFLGFERAPRNAGERKRVDDMVARLKAADKLLQPDPSGGCKLSSVELVSPVLGLGGKPEAGPTDGHDHDHDHPGKDDEAHADIEATIVFDCARVAQVRHIDVKLFDAFKRIRTIDAQVAASAGQFQRTLTPGSSRLGLAR